MISKNFGLDHEVRVIQLNDKIVLTDKNNKEIASLYVDTMTTYNTAEKKDIPTESFFVVFQPVEKSPLAHNIASVSIKEN